MNARLSRSVAALAIAAAGGGLLAWTLHSQPASARGNVGAPVHAASTGHTITVSGHGEVSVAPDQATISLGVQTKGDDAATALANNATRTSAVISAVEAQGVPSSHIQTSNISVWFDDQHAVYQASHELTIRIDGTSKVGAVLDAGVQAGANNSWGVSFDLKNGSAAHDQALQAAVTDARSHADAIASSLGVSISGVGSASEVSYSPLPVYRGVAPAAPGVGVTTPVQPGELTVSADLTIVYTFG